MSIILLPGSNDSARTQFAADLNRVVKKYRGVNRPFVMVMVEEGGEVTVLSNMDKHAEKVSLLSQTATALKQRS